MNTKKTWSLVRRRWSKYSIDSGIEKLIDITVIKERQEQGQLLRPLTN